jgi:hypothetical protein
MRRVKLTHVAVAPTSCHPWNGTFIKNPSRADIIDAIRYAHSQLDPDIEHEYERREDFVCCLQLLDQVGINIYGEIRIAGTYLGTITQDGSEAYERVTSFEIGECDIAMPKELLDPDVETSMEIRNVRSCPCGEVDLSAIENPCREVTDAVMEQRCVEAHEAGESRPLQEFMDELKDKLMPTRKQLEEYGNNMDEGKN